MVHNAVVMRLRLAVLLALVEHLERGRSARNGWNGQQSTALDPFAYTSSSLPEQARRARVVGIPGAVHRSGTQVLSRMVDRNCRAAVTVARKASAHHP